MKHTKGPWVYRPRTENSFAGIVAPNGSDTWHPQWGTTEIIADNPRTEADAHLIATAPEMLEALALILSVSIKSFETVTDEDMQYIYSQANRVLRKARGENA